MRTYLIAFKQIEMMEVEALRKHTLHEKTAASVLFN